MSRPPLASAADEARGRFCQWYPLADARARSPDAPGVFQVKVRGSLLSYPRGKSAMVHYGYGDALSSAVARTVATLGSHSEAARFVCRHQITDDHGAAETLYRSVLDQFVRRFGQPPTVPPQSGKPGA